MRDTSTAMKDMQMRIILSKSAEERIAMAVEMMEDGRRLAMDAIIAKHPNLSPAELTIAFIRKYYSKEFSESQFVDIARWISDRYNART